MLKRFLKSYSNKFVSRWLVLFIDACLVIFSYTLSLILRGAFDFRVIYAESFTVHLAIILLVKLVSFFMYRSYAGIIRHTNVTDAVNVFKALSFSFLIILVSNFITNFIDPSYPYLLPYSTLCIDFFISLFIMISSRFIFKEIYNGLVNNYTEKKKVVIYGAGKSGIITKNTLIHDGKLDYEVVAFIDDNMSIVGKTIEGVRVHNPRILDTDFLERNQISEVIISIQNINANRKREIVDACLTHNINILNVPPVDKWINGELSTKQLRKIRIEELLEREPIKLKKENISREVEGKTVLITGAAGSIGSEICRQLANYEPHCLVFLDQAETPVYELELEFKKSFNQLKFEVHFVIADITDYQRLESVFVAFKPDLVFHAAAYKHVPLMEHNPVEAIKTNVFGTKNVSDLAVKYGTEKFVMVSTDKAVNPTNVMGATKRVAEIYTQSLQQKEDVKTKFITTRFGNVLGSNGSVIPLFNRQIEAGGPITVTHPEITRYFMTIPEACQLVLEAGAMGIGGEIYIFDMGESVKIVDVAKKMIRLRGLEIGKDIEIVFTGLRPGEKLYEELLNDAENTLPTHHPKIMIGKVRGVAFNDVIQQLEALKSNIQSANNMLLVSTLKQIVPEFISNNSEFETIDQKRLFSLQDSK